MEKMEKKRFLEKSVSEQERIFCDCLLAGKTQFESLISAGYFMQGDECKPEMRNKMRNKAASLKNKVAVAVYMQKNKDKIFLTEDLDTTKLKRHIYEIAMGNAKGEFFDRKGICHECAPSFGDQIAAANAFIKMNEIDRKYQLKGVKTVTNDKIQVNKVQSLLDKYKMDKPVLIDDQLDVQFEEIKSLPSTEQNKLQPIGDIR